MGRHIPDDGKITGAANKYLQVKGQNHGFLSIFP
jgi:hypothetical protein